MSLLERTIMTIYLILFHSTGQTIDQTKYLHAACTCADKTRWRKAIVERQLEHDMDSLWILRHRGVDPERLSFSLESKTTWHRVSVSLYFQDICV